MKGLCMTELLKAWRNGKRGKFRRVDGGKVKFIRSHDGVVEKDATTTAGLASDMGSPAAEVSLTDIPCAKCGVAKCSCVAKSCDCLEKVCTCKVEKHEACVCTHDGLCKDAAECDCNCTDRATCDHKGNAAVPLLASSPETMAKVDDLIKTLESKLG